MMKVYYGRALIENNEVKCASQVCTDACLNWTKRIFVGIIPVTEQWAKEGAENNVKA